MNKKQLVEFAKQLDIYKGKSQYTKPQLLSAIVSYLNQSDKEQGIISVPQVEAVCEQIKYENENNSVSQEDDIAYYEIEQIVNILIKSDFIDDEIDENKIGAATTKAKQKIMQKKKKAQQKLEQRKRKKIAGIIKQIDELKLKGVTASNINNKIAVQYSQSMDAIMNKQVKYDGDFKIKYDALTNRFKNMFKRISQNQNINDLIGKNYDVKISAVSGNLQNPIHKTFEVNKQNQLNEKQLKKFVGELLNNPDLYQDEIIKTDTKLILQITSGVKIQGNRSIQQDLRNFIFISPFTQTRCVYDSLAIIQQYKEQQPVVNHFVQIKVLSEQFYKKYKVNGGFSYVEMKMVMNENNVTIYNMDSPAESVTRIGVLIYNQHCIVILPKTEQNIIYAETLKQQYQQEVDQIMQPYKTTEERYEEAVEKCDGNNRKISKIKTKRPCKYAFYDFEWTYGVDDKTKEYVYGWSIKFMDREVQIMVGLNIEETLVKIIHEYAKQNPDYDIILYAHNGQKADYPLIHKYLKNYFRKDFQDIGTKMSTLAYVWNLDEQRIQFQDSLSLFNMSLKEASKLYCKTCFKDKVNHDKINIENWEQQFIEQDIEKYMKLDVLSLEEIFLNYDQQILDNTEISILEENILSSSSLTQKMFFKNYYDSDMNPIYQVPDNLQEYGINAYQGGSCQVFMRGHLKDVKIYAIDINSSYPAQMRNYKYPTGPYEFREIGSVRYQGQYLLSGIYKCRITSPKGCKYPLFMKYVEGKNIPANFINEEKYITLPEIEYGFSLGYEFTLLSAVVSKRDVFVFRQYIDELYQQRRDVKKQMKQYEKGSLEYNSLNAQQLQIKNFLNSLYGKFGTSIYKKSVQITSNQDMIYELLKNGQINTIQEIDQIHDTTFYRIDTNMQQKSQYVNHVIASYITAFARIQLNTIQQDCAKLGFQPLYSDTDSVYFMADKKWTNQQINEQMDKLGQIHCHDSIIGKCKFETEDDIGEMLSIYNKDQEVPLKHHFADEAVFLSTKTYALKSNYTGQCLLKGKGISQWMFEKMGAETDDEGEEIQIDVHLKRRQFNNNEKPIKFEDYVKCLRGNEGDQISFNTVQQSVSKKDDYQKIGKELQKKTFAKYDQKNITKAGRCIPKVIRGCIDSDEDDEFILEDEYIQFSTIQDIASHLDSDVKTVKNDHIIIRDERTNKFILFRDYHCFKQFFDEHIKDKPKNERFYHQIHGDKFNVCFDIDAKDDLLDDWEDMELDEQQMIEQLETHFNSSKQYDIEVVNRCREGKISYHIRFNYVIEKQVLILLLNKINGCPISGFIDCNIYHTQFRITTNDIRYLYNPLNMEVTPDSITRKDLAQLKRTKQRQDLKYTKQQLIQNHDGTKQKVQDIVEECGLDQQFKFRDVCENGKSTIIRLFNNGKYDCPDCERCHEKDNCIFIQHKYCHKKKQIINTVKCFKHINEQKFKQ